MWISQMRSTSRLWKRREIGTGMLMFPRRPSDEGRDPAGRACSSTHGPDVLISAAQRIGPPSPSGIFNTRRISSEMGWMEGGNLLTDNRCRRARVMQISRSDPNWNVSCAAVESRIVLQDPITAALCRWGGAFLILLSTSHKQICVFQYMYVSEPPSAVHRWFTSTLEEGKMHQGHLPPPGYYGLFLRGKSGKLLS